MVLPRNIVDDAVCPMCGRPPEGDMTLREMVKNVVDQSDLPKAKVTVSVEYLGEYFEEEGEVDGLNFWDDLGDVVAGIDYLVREAAEKRLKVKSALKEGKE